MCQEVAVRHIDASLTSGAEDAHAVIETDVQINYPIFPTEQNSVCCVCRAQILYLIFSYMTAKNVGHCGRGPHGRDPHGRDPQFIGPCVQLY